MRGAQESEWRYQRLLERCGAPPCAFAEPPLPVPREEEDEDEDERGQQQQRVRAEEEARGVPFYREAAAGAADVQRVVARERAARDEARKAREDPMVRVARCLGDDSFLQPHTAGTDVDNGSGKVAHSRPVHHHHHKHKHKHKHRHRHRKRDDDDDDEALRALRAERLARETRERARTEQLLQESAVPGAR